jgi:LacI family transcriptional regulator
LRAEHLLDRGFRNFAMLTSREAAAKLESAEFHRLMRDAGFASVAVKTPTHIAKTHAKWKETEALIAEWMHQWQLPIGVHVHSDFTGRVVVQKCLERGWRVPEDVGIVVGMNEKSICEQLEPSLSSVEMGYERVGYQAAELLDRLMDKKRRSSKKKATRSDPSHILVPPKV